MHKFEDSREILHYALDLFVKHSSRAYKNRHKEFLRRVHDQVKTHYLDLWKHFENDPEYKKGLQESSAWLRSFKKTYPMPPTNFWELKLCLGACEAYMLVADY